MFDRIVLILLVIGQSFLPIENLQRISFRVAPWCGGHL